MNDLSSITDPELIQAILNNLNNIAIYGIYVKNLESENQQLKQIIKELEGKLEFEKLMDDDLK